MENINSSQNSFSTNGAIEQLTAVLLTIGQIAILIINLFWAALEATYRLIIQKPQKSLKGEIVLITGAGMGIGRELALLYASEGATVVCFDILEDQNQETVKMISDLGYVKPYGYTCNVADYARVTELCDQVQREVGNITILINNAGIGTIKRFCDMSRLEIENTVNTNLMSQFWTVKAILPSMLKNNYGHIVAMSSLMSYCALPYAIPYCTTKCAIKGFMDGLQKELALIKNCHIKTTVVCPYATNTRIGMFVNLKHPSLMPLLKQRDVAKCVINAQRREFEEITIPNYYYPIFSFFRLLPANMQQILFNFFEMKLETMP